MADDLKDLQRQMLAKRRQLAEWRAKHQHPLTLPSGLEAVVRDVSMTDLAMTGRLPEAVLAMAEEAEKSGAQALNFNARDINRLGPEFMKLLNLTAEIALVEPKIGAQADDDHMTLGELGTDDKMAIFDFVNREVADLRPFREGEAEPAEAGEPGDGIRAETQRDVGPANGNRGLAD